VTQTYQKFEPGVGNADVITGLVEHLACIKALSVFPYNHPTLLQDRLDLDDIESDILTKGLNLRASTNLPFWDSLLGSCFGRRAGYRRLVEAAQFHQSHRDSFVRVSREDVLSDKLTSMAATVTDTAWSLFSSIELNDGTKAHFPLMDFHCPESEWNDGLVSVVCRQLFRGTVYVFSSGKSYHAIGSALLDAHGLQRFLARALLFSPIIDGRYVAHQLLEEGCALRLTSSKDKPQVPRLKFAIHH
jgi:hypothetical protein